MINSFNSKELLILEQYRFKIEAQTFEETDIVGFLILIREHIQELPVIQELCNLVAHRTRNQGIVYKATKQLSDKKDSILNVEPCYIEKTEKWIYEGVKKINNAGIVDDEWRRDIELLFASLNIKFTEEILYEFKLCLFSIMHISLYEDKNGMKGVINLVQSDDNVLMLAVYLDEPKTPFVVFSAINSVEFDYMYPIGLVEDPVIAVRVNGKLRLKSNKGYIV